MPEKDGNVRLTVDYRGLNAITHADSYPLPRLDELLHEANQTKHMKTLDLQSGYYQVPVKPLDWDKTAFTTPFGTYRFLRMPFGLKNAHSMVQTLMNGFKNLLTNIFLFLFILMI